MHSASSINKFNCCDYIPVVSSVNSLFYLFKKASSSCCRNGSNGLNNVYSSELDNKNIARHIILLFPGIGNLIIGVYDFSRHYIARNSDSMLQAIAADPKALERAAETLKGNADFMLKAIELNPKALEHAAETLKENADFMLKAIAVNPKALEHAAETLKNKAKFFFAAISINKECLNFLVEPKSVSVVQS